MKNLLFSGLFALSAFMTNAQSIDYSNNNGWSPNIRNTYNSNTCTGGGFVSNAATQVTGTILINPVTGRMEYDIVGGAHENRISRALGNVYDQQFNIDLEFNITNIPNRPSDVHLVALTSLDRSVLYDMPMTVCGAAPIMDALTLHCATPNTTAITPKPLSLSIDVWDEGIFETGNTGSVLIQFGVTYFARIQVFNNGRGNLSVFLDADRTDRVGDICFNIPSTVNGLSVLQHSNNIGAGHARRSTAWVDNTNIYTTKSNCCEIDIVGNNVICLPSDSSSFTISTNGVSETMTAEPSDVTLANIGGNWVVTNWGNLDGESPKIVTLTATAICNCEEITTTQLVYVYPAVDDASFNLSGIGTSGPNLTNFSAVSTLGAASSTHTWEIMSSNAASNPGPSVRPIFTSTGTGSTFNIISSASPQLQAGTYYLIRHTLNHPGNICGEETSARLIFISASMLIIDLGEVNYQNSSEKMLTNGGELNNNSKIIISPNPTMDKVNIRSNEDISEIVVLDGNGRVLKTLTKISNNITVDLSSFERGTYTLKITTVNNTTQIERIVKN